MSGEKRTPLQIAQQDIRMLERQVSSLKSNQQKAIRDTKQACEAEIDRLNRIHNTQAADMMMRINQMSSEMRLARLAHQQELSRQAHTFKQAHERQTAQFESSQRAIYRQLSESIEETHSYIRSIEKKHAQQIDHLRNNINRLYLHQKNNWEKAALLLQDLNKEFEVVSVLPYKKFAAEQIKEILSHVKNIKTLPAESQISIAHTAMQDLIRLEEHIQQAIFRYDSLHLQIIQSIDALLGEMQYNRSNLYFEDQDGNKGEQIQIDFWTEGKYKELENILRNIRENTLENYSDPDFTQRDLEETYQLVQQMRTQADQLVKEAIERGNASAMRASIAEKIAQTLHDSHCYEPVDYGYEQQDPRKSFLVKMRNSDNQSDIIILIYPESTQKQQLILKTRSDGYLSENDLYTRAQEINEELNAVGITISGPAQTVNAQNEHSLDELYDIAAILHEKGEGIPSTVLRNAGLQSERPTNKLNFS